MGGSPEVSWNDCQEFLKTLTFTSKLRKLRADLPTEAEWEEA
jgi:formylglycine-generating enzyme required for sulfatase activity